MRLRRGESRGPTFKILEPHIPAWIGRTLDRSHTEPSSAQRSISLGDFSDSLARITSKVTKCIVTLVADTYITENEIDQEFVHSDAEHTEGDDDGLLSSTNFTGSGMIVSSDGYIVTNACSGTAWIADSLIDKHPENNWNRSTREQTHRGKSNYRIFIRSGLIHRCPGFGCRSVFNSFMDATIVNFSKN